MNNQTSLKIGDRQVEIKTGDQPADVYDVAKALARILTGGDPAGYVRRLTEKTTTPPDKAT